jgi:hypothetical protein
VERRTWVGSGLIYEHYTRMERLAKDKHSNLILAYHKLTDVKFASYLVFNLHDIFFLTNAVA